jgi:hypothetical protein
LEKESIQCEKCTHGINNNIETKHNVVGAIKECTEPRKKEKIIVTTCKKNFLKNVKKSSFAQNHVKT